jgi:hypothetical protein
MEQAMAGGGAEKVTIMQKGEHGEMCSNDEREWCLRQVRDGFWRWSVTLQCATKSEPAFDLEIAFATWINEIASEHGSGSCISYVRLIERHDSGGQMFRVLLENVPDRMKCSWKVRWGELSGGTAWDRPLETEPGTMFERLVRVEHCHIEAQIGWNKAVCPGEQVQRRGA